MRKPVRRASGTADGGWEGVAGAAEEWAVLSTCGVLRGRAMTWPRSTVAIGAETWRAELAAAGGMHTAAKVIASGKPPASTVTVASPK